MTDTLAARRLPSTSASCGPPPRQAGTRALLDWLKTMRDAQPVWLDPRGIYNVFRYDDAARILNDYAAFSSDLNRIMPNGGGGFEGASLMLTDPPVHRKLRHLVSQAFTPKMAAGMVPRIRELANQLLDGIEGDSFDLVREYAHPLPVMVIAEMLGVPIADRDQFRIWADRLVALKVDDPTNAEIAAIVGRAMQEMGEYLLGHVKQRRSEPGTDLLSELVCAEVDGKRLRDDEVVNASCLLLLAGQITSTMALGNAILCFQGAPGAESALRSDPSLIPSAFEEVLRMRPPLTQAARITTADVMIGPETAPPNRMVISWLLSANYDERQFPDPERFDVNRRPNRQFAFGHGIHFCLGAGLARIEGDIALRLLFDRFSEMHAAPAEELPYYEDPMFGVKELPVEVRRA
jgi:cytochrome P450